MTAPKVSPAFARVDFLDGIRGWASFIVLLTHLVVNLLALSTPALNVTPQTISAELSGHRYLEVAVGTVFRVITNGHLAVMIFFVLSGFALSVSHFNLSKNTLPSAAAARYFRLMIPVLATSLIAYALLKAGLFFNIAATSGATLDPGDWINHTYSFAANLKNVLLFACYDVFFKYDYPTSYNISLWTMPVELVGSFFIYGFLALFRRNQHTQWGLASLLAIALLNSMPVFACFILGYLIAELNNEFDYRKTPLILQCALVTIFVTSCILSTLLHFDGDRVTCAIATSIVASATFSPTLRAVFSTALSRFLGRISFPLYLIQIPVICSWSSYLYMKLPSWSIANPAANTLNFLTSVCICLGLSVALLPVERFSMSASKRLGALLLRRPDSAAPEAVLPAKRTA